MNNRSKIGMGILAAIGIIGILSIVFREDEDVNNYEGDFNDDMQRQYEFGA